MEKHKEWIRSWFDGLRLSLLYTKPEGDIKGVLQISHGMCENKERYLPFMEYLAEQGYAAVIHDHRGHGKSVKRKEDLGYFYGGRDKGIVEDLHQITCWIKRAVPGKTCLYAGTQYGSLAARVYLKDYDRELKKLILTGTAQRQPGSRSGTAPGAAPEKAERRAAPKQAHSGPGLGPYAARFPGEGSESAWICSDKKVVEEYDRSEYCGFVFYGRRVSGSVSAFKGRLQS